MRTLDPTTMKVLRTEANGHASPRTEAGRIQQKIVDKALELLAEQDDELSTLLREVMDVAVTKFEKRIGASETSRRAALDELKRGLREYAEKHRDETKRITESVRDLGGENRASTKDIMAAVRGLPADVVSRIRIPDPPKIPEFPKPVLKWRTDVTARGADGLIKSVTHTAVQS